MKYINIVILLFCALASFSQDTIYVSTKNTSYITFPEDINYFDIGLPENFVADVGQGLANEEALKDNFDKKMLKVKCIKPTTDVSSLMISFGNKYEMITLKYQPQPKKFFHKMYLDLNKNSTQSVDVKPVAKTTGNNSNLPTATTATSTSKERLKLLSDSVLKMKNELREYGFIDDYLQAGVTVIRNDNFNTYLKIAIQNKSSIPYRFDFISFQYVQKMNKGAIKSKKKAPQDVFPNYVPPFEAVPANSGKYVTFAIPQFGLANNGYLLILFREKSGDRTLKIYIPSTVIQGSSHIN